MRKWSIHVLLFTSALLFLPTAFTNAAELAPGRITNPEGLQRFQGVAFNPSGGGEWMLIYQAAGAPRVRRLGLNGTFLAPFVDLDGQIGVSNVGIVYNPNANQYLVVYRTDNGIFGRYLGSNGQPIGNRFLVGVGGAFGTISYSETSDRYLVGWREGPTPITVRYALIDGDSTSVDPVIERKSLARGDNVHTAWGSQTDKFMVVYSRSAGTSREEVFAKILDGDGSGVSGEIFVMGGARAQTNPQVGYASTVDRFLVSVADWRKLACCRADVNGQLVGSNGALVGGRFPIVNSANGLSDVTGPIGFNEVTGLFIVTAYAEPRGWVREVNPSNGSRGALIELGNEINVPIAIANRNHPDDPQALVLSRANLGGDGVHAHIVPLEIPPPSVAPTALPDGAVGTFYSRTLQAIGGTAPFTFSYVSGTRPPGVGGPTSGGLISGNPTTPGTYVFRVRVTDNDGRMSEADVTISIGLAAPDLNGPNNLAMTSRTPTFDWDPVPGAATYDLFVENITRKKMVIRARDLVATEFTKASNLPAGKEYRWRVMAKNGAIESAFSAYAHFEIDTKSPPVIKLSGDVPEPNSPISGLTAIDVSSENAGNKRKENAVDGRNKTAWLSEGTNVQQEEFITVDLGASYQVSQISVRSKRGPRFPVDFHLELGNSPAGPFVTLASLSNFNASGNTWYDFPVVTTTGRYVRIRVTKKGAHRGTLWAEMSEIGVFRPINTAGSILYSFKSPADDEGTKIEPVVSYDLRYMVGNAAAFNFAAATQFGGEPTPSAFGATEFILVQGLNSNTTYSAAITSTDDAGNVSIVSNIVTVTTEP